MLLERNVVGKKTDWANYITLADEHETPMLRVLPKGPKPVNVVKHYQADTYTAPVANAWPDGKDWDSFTSAGQNRKELTARCQWFVKTAAVSATSSASLETAAVCTNHCTRAESGLRLAPALLNAAQSLPSAQALSVGAS